VRFLADMNVDSRVVVWLRENGHDATHLRDEGLQRMPDANIFAKAQTESRIVITFDLDFGEIAAATAGKGASVILFRLQNKRTSFVLQRLGSILETSKLALENGAVVVVEDSRHRIRQLPIGKLNRGE
jgi:predicted nuclease of predicted toxin-antitoxin system